MLCRIKLDPNTCKVKINDAHFVFFFLHVISTSSYHGIFSISLSPMICLCYISFIIII